MFVAQALRALPTIQTRRSSCEYMPAYRQLQTNSCCSRRRRAGERSELRGVLSTPPWLSHWPWPSPERREGAGVVSASARTSWRSYHVTGASIQFTFGFSTSTTNSPIAKLFHWYFTFCETRDHRVAHRRLGRRSPRPLIATTPNNFCEKFARDCPTPVLNEVKRTIRSIAVWRFMSQFVMFL